MMQLLCEGVYLDLHDDFGLQFTHKNPLFAFDGLECERTTQFKLPSTPTNDAVLGLARIPAYAGTGMRRKFDAELQAGMVVKNGYLYVSAFDESDYSAVFVTGELVGLQAIKNAGKIKDIMTYSDYVTIGAASQTPTAARGTIWENVNYRKPKADTLIPSIELQRLYETICTQLGITAQAFPASLYGMRIVPAKAKGANEDMLFTQEIIDHDQPASDWIFTPFDSITYNNELFGYEDESYVITRLGQAQYYYVRQFKAKTNLKITFPVDWDSKMYLVDFSKTASQGYLAFLGARSFKKTQNQQGVTTHGEPLAGRTIDIQTGTTWCFVNSDEYIYVGGSGLPTTHGFIFDTEFEGEWTLNIKTEDVVPVGDICRLQDNLPDCTFVELLKTIAALSGTVLNYDETNGISFDPLDVSTFPVREVVALIKRGEIKRTFADYAQNNIVSFKSNDSVQDAVTTDYEIYNDNLEQSKSLQVIPFSEGENLDNALLIEGDNKQPTIGADAGGLYLVQAELPQCAGLQTLCTKSTQLKVTARLTLPQYMGIGAKTILLVDNTQYVWTERSWQDDVAQFTLAKIA